MWPHQLWIQSFIVELADLFMYSSFYIGLKFMMVHAFWSFCLQLYTFLQNLVKIISLKNVFLILRQILKFNFVTNFSGWVLFKNLLLIMVDHKALHVTNLLFFHIFKRLSPRIIRHLSFIESQIFLLLSKKKKKYSLYWSEWIINNNKPLNW